MIEEVLKHRTVEQVVMVEIDQRVLTLCQKYFTKLSLGAFDDPRLELIIGNGAEYAANICYNFDIIIVVSPDPIGPGTDLFSEKFSYNCHRCLGPNGVLVTQSGVPFVQTEELRNSASRLSQHFMDVAFYRASIPTYYGGDMAFGWASDTRILRTVSVAQLQDRFARANIMTQYYSPEVHLAAFAIPPWISKIFQTNNSTTDSA